MKRTSWIISLSIFFLWVALIIPCLFSLGCASFAKTWKNLISDQPVEEKSTARAMPTSFSKQNNMLPTAYRKYKRTTRKDIENTAHLESKSGSLWVMEGQGAYLFSQNIVRMIGDPLAIKIEGDPNEQLATKTRVIAKLLAAVEDRRRRALGRGPASEDKKDGAAAPGTQPDQPSNPNNPGAKPGALVPGQNPQNPVAIGGLQNDEENELFNVKLVPTRVVERLIDGNYRVRGTQPFMIGSREYKVIVTGIVRAEDFNEDGISATQLLDSNFDIVSSKGAESRL